MRDSLGLRSQGSENSKRHPGVEVKKARWRVWGTHRHIGYLIMGSCSGSWSHVVEFRWPVDLREGKTESGGRGFSPGVVDDTAYRSARGTLSR